MLNQGKVRYQQIFTVQMGAHEPINYIEFMKPKRRMFTHKKSVLYLKLIYEHEYLLDKYILTFLSILFFRNLFKDSPLDGVMFKKIGRKKEYKSKHLDLTLNFGLKSLNILMYQLVHIMVKCCWQRTLPEFLICIYFKILK